MKENENHMKENHMKTFCPALGRLRDLVLIGLKGGMSPLCRLLLLSLSFRRPFAAAEFSFSTKGLSAGGLSGGGGGII